MKIFLIFFLLLSTQSWGNSIEMTKDSVILAGSSINYLNELLVEGSDNATSTNKAPKVYIPFFDKKVAINGIEQPNIEYSIFTPVDLSTSTAFNVLPSFSEKSPQNESVIRHKFTIQADNAYVYLFAAQEVGGNLYILNSSIQGNPLLKIPQTTGRQTVSFGMDLKVLDLCGSLSKPPNPGPFPCEGLDYEGSNFDSVTNTVSIYFFLVDGPNDGSTPAISGIPKPTDYPNGIYFTYLLGNSVISKPPIIDSVAKGDERVKVNYSAGSGIAELYDVYAIKYPVTAIDTNQQNYFKARREGGIIASEDNGAKVSGNLIVKNLINGETIKVGLGYVNKFYFISEISDAEEQTPESIQTFLQEKECYLLSAGFQKNHYVLEYFRMIRDNFLLENIWGRDFIRWYYRTAPYYAEIIYNNAFLRFIVRSFGYVAYYLIRFFPILLFFLIVIFTFKKISIIRE